MDPVYTNLEFGPLTSKLLLPFPWKDGFPSWQDWADELEQLLSFADAQGRIDDFLSRLRTERHTQRDAALNELRVALFFDRSGFPILKWDPPGLAGRVGEFSIVAREGCAVFSEVKSRGWESELSEAERLAGRTKLPKYLDGEGGAFANWEKMRECIASPKTYPKFASTQPNLLVIADNLFVGLLDAESQIEIALYDKRGKYGGEIGYFASPIYSNLGGVAAFAAESRANGVEYHIKVYGNPYALSETNLPHSVLSLCA
jgi:hypothetical protein